MKIFKIFLLTLISTYSILIGINQLQTVSQSKIDAENKIIESIKNNDEPIVCILKANKRKYKIGEKPDIEVQVINKTDSTMTLVGSLDGSCSAMRLPISQFTVRHQLFGKKERSYYMACLNLNEYRYLDFWEVKADSIFNPYKQIDNSGFFPDYILQGTTFSLPGIYTLTYYYSTNPKDTYFYHLSNSEEDSSDTLLFEDLEIDRAYYNYRLRYNEVVDSFFNRTPEVQLKSNTITIEYDF